MVNSIRSEFAENVRSILRKSKALIKDTSITVVANVKGQTQTNDYHDYSVITDFFSEKEMEEIITAFRSFGYYVEAFVDEMDFIKVIVGGNKGKQRLREIVYNTSQKGTGASRHALMPAFCKLYEVPYIGSNGYVSSLCRHKYHFNNLLFRYQEHLPKAWMYENGKGWLLDQKPPVGLKVILKPIYEAASIGITEDSVIAYSPASEEHIKNRSEKLNQPLQVEEFIEGYEVEVPIIIDARGIHPLGPVGISLNGSKLLGDKILGYETVYDDQYSFYDFFPHNPETSMGILDCASLSAKVLGMEDFGRIDFRVSSNGKFYLMDVTTNPHTTVHSSCNFIFHQLGFNHGELLSTLAAVAAERYCWL